MSAFDKPLLGFSMAPWLFINRQATAFRSFGGCLLEVVLIDSKHWKMTEQEGQQPVTVHGIAVGHARHFQRSVLCAPTVRKNTAEQVHSQSAAFFAERTIFKVGQEAALDSFEL